MHRTNGARSAPYDCVYIATVHRDVVLRLRRYAATLRTNGKEPLAFMHQLNVDTLLLAES
jgi:hypothetical protein